MKSFLQNLLMIFALSLCGLIWYQWVREGRSRQEIQRLNDVIHEKLDLIQSLEGQMKSLKAEVGRLDRLKTELTATVKSNHQHIASLSRDLDRANSEVDRHVKQIEVYKEALDRANDAIKKQNEDVKRQNEEMKQLAEERNEMVAKYNKVVAEFNDLAAKWNKLQEALAQTNQPPAKKQ